MTLPPVRRPTRPIRPVIERQGRLIAHVPHPADLGALRLDGRLLGLEVEPHLAYNVYGWRPRRGFHAAMGAARWFIRRRARRVISCDVVSCFTTTDQHVAANAVRRTVGDPWWIRYEPWLPPSGGIPEGHPFSARIVNLIFSRLDHRFIGSMIRYADDFIVAEERSRSVISAIGDLGYEVHEVAQGPDVVFCNRTITQIAGPPPAYNFAQILRSTCARR